MNREDCASSRVVTGSLLMMIGVQRSKRCRGYHLTARVVPLLPSHVSFGCVVTYVSRLVAKLEAG